MGKRIADYDCWDFEVVFLSENKVTYTDTPFSQTGLSSESAQAIMDHLAGNEIPDFFFYDCQYIESVVIPDGITYIGVYALPGSLRIMDFGNAEAAFSDCFDGGGTLKEVYIRNKAFRITDGTKFPFITIETIYGYKGSTAAQIARNMGATFVPLD